MRIDVQSAMEKASSFHIIDSHIPKTSEREAVIPTVQNNDASTNVSEEQIQRAINSINEFIKVNNSQLKYVYHEELGEYFVQLINTETEEVVREIPPKKLLDAYYEMQKLAGIIVDKKI
ncbi:flagellar protein FlaG [Ureibacillus thermophilus]|uniref:flagellar protein FlaG n=1 Tax=Ureibacillus thermophilus TaxID=367743 RepID=UPI0036153A52